MMKLNTLYANCGEWKRVAYVYEPSVWQVSEYACSKVSQGSLSHESCLDLGKVASVDT